MRSLRHVVSRPALALFRAAYQNELLPARVRWWLAAKGMDDWFRVLCRSLSPHLLGQEQVILGNLAASLFRRRWDVLRKSYPHLRAAVHKDDRALPLLMDALYRQLAPWVLQGLGGGPRDLGERLRGQRLILPLSVEARWEEVTVHLGELLIVLTEELPRHLPHTRKILGEICFAAGAKYGKRVKKMLELPDDPAVDQAKQAIMVLRMSEYIFRVNPEHWAQTDPSTGTGYLEGTACPWYDRPGWHGAHCGIFGQFQAGICSVFGLRYRLSQTIPKHGGHTCRVDLVKR